VTVSDHVADLINDRPARANLALVRQQLEILAEGALERVTSAFAEFIASSALPRCLDARRHPRVRVLWTCNTST
jgi:hypothetical protein